MAFTNTTSAPVASAATGISTLLNTLVARYKKHRVYRETVEGLSALSNRELADLGMGRSDIARVAIEAANA
jgi:uncharacterized protein YjiS (DUF1127 family)